MAGDLTRGARNRGAPATFCLGNLAGHRSSVIATLTPFIPFVRHAVVAIPARNEAGRIAGCLGALAAQRGARAQLTVLLLANNCTDGTAAEARRLAPTLPFRLLVEDVALPPHQANAGKARGHAMDLAAALHPAVLLGTDADSRVAPDWLAENLRAIGAGADAVAGAIAPDARELAALPAGLRRRDAQERAYANALDELAALIDPEPHDPWPRHAMHSGASIALTLAAYRRIGGVPALPVGEDRALFAAVRASGLRLRHSLAARVSVSCRLEGRAVGGMADTLRHRLAETDDAQLDETLEPVANVLHRLRCRRALRRLWLGRGSPAPVRELSGLSAAAVQVFAAQPFFWAAWTALEAAAPRLRDRQPLSWSALPREFNRAATALRALRPAGRADTAPTATAA